MKNSLNWLNSRPNICSMQSPPSDVFLFHLQVLFSYSCQWNGFRAGVLSERSQAEKANPAREKRLPWLVSGKEFTCDAGDLGLIPGSGRSLGEGNGNPLQYSYLENPIDRRAWWAAVHGITKELDMT